MRMRIFIHVRLWNVYLYVYQISHSRDSGTENLVSPNYSEISLIAKVEFENMQIEEVVVLTLGI